MSLTFSFLRHPFFRATLPTVLGTVLIGSAGLFLCDDLNVDIFAGGAAQLVAWLTGAPLESGSEGYLLLLAGQTIAVTAACRATDFFLITAALFSWHGARRFNRPLHLPLVALGALGVALPVTLLVNALRIIAVAQAHRWISPQVPADYDAFLHLLTGLAVFLPALITVNLVLEHHGRRHLPLSR